MSDQSHQLTEYLQALLTRTSGAAMSPPDTEPEAQDRAAVLRERAEQVRAAVTDLDEQRFNGLTEDEEERQSSRRAPRVLAEVNGRGALLSLDINAQAMHDYDAAELAAACTEAIKASRLQAAAQMEQTFAGLAPPDAELPAPPDLSGMDASDILRRAKEVTQRWSSPASRP